MRIGIITHPLHTNYGGVLQNFALQVILRRLGHDPITLREALGYQGRSNLWFAFQFPVMLAKDFIKKIIGRNQGITESIWSWRKRVSGIEGFVQRNISCTRPKRIFSVKDVKNNNIDAIVIGSDQVWRPMLSSMIDNAFCGFLKNSEIPRMAYAASFGLDQWVLSNEQTIEARELVKLFKAVSVREYSGVDLCKKHLGVDAKWVLDPTLLLSKEDYLKISMNVPIDKEKFVFAYFLDEMPGQIDLAFDAAKKLGCKLHVLKIGKNINQSDTVERWLANFRDAEYVVTDSFHGAVFSILFNKNFICFYNTSGGNARMDGLRTITGLDDRFVNKLSTPIIYDIDYAAVSKRLDKMRLESIQFLKSYLND
jgi:hypothetical protein